MIMLKLKLQHNEFEIFVVCV